MLQPVASCRIRWLTAAEGGRRSPLPGPAYFPTARFLDEQELFSVVVRTPPTASGPLTEQKEVEINLLFPDRLSDIAAKIVPHAKLQITEGARTVAECEVTTVRMDDFISPLANYQH